MANGRLGTADLSANTNETLYQVPDGFYSVATINVCNRGTNTAAVRVAVCTTETPGNAEYIEFDVQLAPKGVLERTGVVIESNAYVVVRSDQASVNAMVYGIETAQPGA
jgi:hypothetical protein